MFPRRSIRQDLKPDTVLFPTRDGCAARDRAAAKLLAPCEIEVRQIDASGDGPRVDVLIHATPDVARRAHRSDAANRVEIAMRRATEHRIRMLQWVEEGASEAPRPGTGAGDASPGHPPVGRANSGMPHRRRRDSQGHGSGQPGDRQFNPSPGPRSAACMLARMNIKHFKLIAIGVALVIVIVLILQNTQQVETRVLFATIQMPRAVLLFITASLGFLAGLLVAFRRTARPGD